VGTSLDFAPTLSGPRSGHFFGPTPEKVEAAGVEPASEKPCRQETTCLFGSVGFTTAVRYRQEPVAASPVGFAGAASGGGRADYPAGLTSLSQPQAAETGRAT